MPVVIHPLRVATILRAAGFSEFKDETILIAALFHDLIEDAGFTEQDIAAQWGEEVAAIVKQLSKPVNGSKEEYLAGLARASREAQIIKLADRIDNLHDMQGWSLAKKQSYAEQAKIILKTCGPAHLELKRMLRREIDRILEQKE